MSVQPTEERRAGDRRQLPDPMGEEAVEAALRFLTESAHEAGVAQAQVKYLENFRKITLARLRRESPEKSIDARDNWARTHQEYIDVVDAQNEAIAKQATLYWKRTAAEATISAWQTRSSNQRAALQVR